MLNFFPKDQQNFYYVRYKRDKKRRAKGQQGYMNPSKTRQIGPNYIKSTSFSRFIYILINNSEPSSQFRIFTLFKLKVISFKLFLQNKQKKYQLLNFTILNLYKLSDVTNILKYIFSMRKLITNNQLMTAYQFMHSLGCITFALATIATLPYLGLQQDQSSYIFNVLLKFSALAFTATEILELVTVPIPKWRTSLCAVSISGQIAYFCSTQAYSPFNSGPLYIWGSFQVICAALLKILSIVMEKRQLDDIIRRGKNRFFQYGLVAVASVTFLIATLIEWKTPRSSTLGCVLNAISGCILPLSILSFFWQQKYKEYQRFNAVSSMTYEFS